MPGALAAPNPKLDAVYDVIIDESGRFKYILCKVYENNKPDDCKYIVRGTASAEYHSDIYDDLDAQLEEYGLICECAGGGKILHENEQKQISVFGKSQGYGAANHEKTADLLKKKYPDYVVVWSDE